jgi:N-formylglutamate deformylase
MATFELLKGTRPLLISMPHQGIQLSDAMMGQVTPIAKTLADTDWHLKELYDFARHMGASIIWPHYSRYVIDLNRPADNSNLYPGANSTELCPTSTFASEPIYLPGCEPDETEIAHRLEHYWQPYHSALQDELTRIKAQCGVAVLFEAHSIRSVVPRLFEGQLPDLSIGTSSGASCSTDLQSAIEQSISSQKKYSTAINQRFKGGYITRAYGQPSLGVHALQLELTQHCYMNEELPFTYLPERAKNIQPILEQLVSTLLQWAEVQ